MASEYVLRPDSGADVVIVDPKTGESTVVEFKRRTVTKAQVDRVRRLQHKIDSELSAKRRATP